MRLFIAVLFPEAVVDRLAAIRDALHDESAAGSFTSRPNLHLTLEFLGECGLPERRAAEEAMAAVTFQPFQIRFSRIGFFQRPDGDIWWAGADESEELMTMQGSLHRQLLKRGLSLEKRKYRPHVTLGRRVISSCRSGRIEPVTACVSSISLMLSERSEHGMIYSELFSSGPGQGWSE